MSLTAAEVAEILRLVEGSSFDEFSLELDGLKLNFKRSADGSRPPELPAGAASPHAANAANATNAANVANAANAAPLDPPAAVAAADPNMHDVHAPMLGTFYRAPKPGEPPYVAVGDVVEKDTIVGIIEVMKLMNTVRAEARGAVAEILVADGAFVEYGEILLRVRKSV
jgi:acetyl-CoA carboxylase biotin carboxyl carrier protein